MKLAKILAFICLLAMTGILIYAFAFGNFSEDGAKILTNPWGIVSLVDLYAGFILFSLWIVFRAKSWIGAVVWVILMMTLGFWAGSLYTLIALYRSDGNWQKFWLGNRVPTEQNPL